MAPPRVPKAKIDKVLSLVAQGYFVAKATKEDGTCSQATFFNWLNHGTDKEIAEKLERYSRAKADRAETIFEEMLEIADDATADDYNPRRLQIHTRQWMLGKMAPSKYGDKLDVHHGGNVVVEIKK